MDRCHFGTCDQLVLSDGLCLFHMPKQASNAGPEAAAIATRFGDELQRVLARWSDDPGAEVLELDGVVFPDLQLLDQRLAFCLKLTNAHFAGPLSIRRSFFDGGMSLQGATFAADVEIIATKFGRSDSRTQQDGDGQLVLSNAVFRQRATFDDIYCADLLAEGTIFEGALRMTRCNTFGKAVFDRAVFASATSFQTSAFYGPVSFRGASVTGVFDLEAEMDAGLFHATLDFSSVAQDDASICFSDVNLSAATFLSTNIEDVRFRNVTWAMIDGRSALSHEATLRSADASMRPFAFLQRDRPTHYERLAENYRQLVLNYEKKRDYRLAEDFHIGEMETQRRRQIISIGYWLYWILSKYGTSYVRALIVLIVMVLGFAAAFLLAGFREVDADGKSGAVVAYDLALDAIWPPPPELGRDLREACLFLLSNLTARQRMYQPRGWEARLVLALSVIALASQVALFLFALRRRFKR